MITRRTFTTLLTGMAGATAAPRLLWSQTAMPKTVFYSSVGPELTQYDVDVKTTVLVKRASVTLPGNVQYAWPHPARHYLYVAWSDGGVNDASGRPSAGHNHGLSLETSHGPPSSSARRPSPRFPCALRTCAVLA